MSGRLPPALAGSPRDKGEILNILSRCLPVRHLRLPLAATVVVVALCSAPVASFAFARTSASQTSPDDTAHNKRHNTTADQQGNSKADIEMTASIRKSVLADKSLSTYAHNVKIITNNGVVTLRGPVRSQDEEQAIVEKATAAAGGSDKVINRITVKGQQ